MRPQQNFKLVSMTPPALIVDNTDYTVAEIDTAGYEYANIICYLGATDIAMAALKVTETDINGNTSALPSSTDDDKFVRFDIDLRGRKRYLDMVATAGDGSAGTYMAVFAILWPKIAPNTVAECGCDTVLRV
jgi:hypothetical protein